MRRAMRWVLLIALSPALAQAQQGAAVPEDIRTALEQEVRQTLEPEICASIEFPQAIALIGHPAYGRGPLEYGEAPFENNYAPGLFRVALATEGASGEYLRLRARMDFLAKLGYFTAEPFTYVYHASEPVVVRSETMGSVQSTRQYVLPVEELRRPQAAIRYTLTREGWVATRGKPCLPLGRPKLIGVQGLKQVEENRQQVAVLEYQIGLDVEGIPFERAELVRGFGEHVLRQYDVRGQKSTFFKTEGGWVSERRMQALLRAATVAEKPKHDSAPAPDLKTLADAIDFHAQSAPGRVQACLKLPAGFEAHDAEGRRHGRAYSASFFDFADLHPQRARSAAAGLVLALDLLRSGAMSMQPATPLILNRPDELGGARFDLAPELYRYISRESGGACLGYAELQIEPRWMRVQNPLFGATSVEFIAMAQPKRIYGWAATEHAKAFPVVAHLQRYGLGVKGTARHRPEGWRVESLQLLEPVYSGPPNPKELFASLPRADGYRKANAAKTTPEIQAIVVRSGGRADAVVNGTGRPLILHLTSALPVEWRLKVAKDAKLLRVVASTPTRAAVRGVPVGVPLEIYSEERLAGREKEKTVPPLVPPRERFFGSGEYIIVTQNAIEAAGESDNLEVVEARLGGEITMVQTEVTAKRFAVPRRWQGR